MSGRVACLNCLQLTLRLVHEALLGSRFCLFSTQDLLLPVDQIVCQYESISLSSSKSYMRGEIGCHGSKLSKEVTEITVHWFVCLNTFKIAKSKNGLFET